MIYSPSEDSYFLSEFVKKYSKRKSVLDMGSGSGIQAEIALKSGADLILCADISRESISHLKSKRLNATKSNLFSKITGKFDLIIFNPPYLPLDKREDKESRKITTGGKKGDEIILRFLKQSQRHLNKEGIILLLLSSLTPKNKINSTIKDKNLKVKILDKKNLFMEYLEVWAIRKKTHK